MYLHFFVFFLFVLNVAHVGAKPVNITVDDKFGPSPSFGSNIVYGDGWNDSGLSECQCGQAYPGFKTAFKGTWKRSTYQASVPHDLPKIATMKFNGTAVFVSIMRAGGTAAGVKGNTELLFTLDGTSSTFVAEAPESVFRQIVFANTSLGAGNHILSMQNGVNGETFDEVMVFLDSITYTTDDSVLTPQQSDEAAFMGSTAPTKRTSAPSVVWIVSAAVGGLATGLAMFGVYLYAQKRRRSTAAPTTPSPTVPASPSRPRPFRAYSYLSSMSVLPQMRPPAKASLRSQNDHCVPAGESQSPEIRDANVIRTSGLLFSSPRPPSYHTHLSTISIPEAPIHRQ